MHIIFYEFSGCEKWPSLLFLSVTGAQMVSFTEKCITRQCSIGLGAESILPDFPAKVQYLVLCFHWETSDNCQIFFSYSAPVDMHRNKGTTQAYHFLWLGRAGRGTRDAQSRLDAWGKPRCFSQLAGWVPEALCPCVKCHSRPSGPLCSFPIKPGLALFRGDSFSMALKLLSTLSLCDQC